MTYGTMARLRVAASIALELLFWELAQSPRLRNPVHCVPVSFSEPAAWAQVSSCDAQPSIQKENFPILSSSAQHTCGSCVVPTAD